MRYVEPSTQSAARFLDGVDLDAYTWLGAHPFEGGWHFSLYAPNARQVSLVGDFNGWSVSSHPMQKNGDGVWSLSLKRGEMITPLYQYAVTGSDGTLRLKQDPYAFAFELRPNKACVATSIEDYPWQDAAWMEKRAQFDPYASPVSIYEVHSGSWKIREDGGFLSYEELIDQLIPYVKDMGYTHIELTPVMEHPLDMSWGYQVSGYFAPTSRFGDPKGLMALIDRCHQAGLGVILDWVPAHFPRDEAGLALLDGTALYDSDDPLRSDMPLWGTKLFDFSRGHVSSFLLSSACFWLQQYHADGLRVDAVSAMIYHDFCKKKGQYRPNEYGGRENLDAIRFLRLLNDQIGKRFHGVMTIAEESTAFPMVTRPTYLGGLGFTFKWNMGWMNDTLSFIGLNHGERHLHHDKLTFPMMYAFDERFILPFSHDEVVHGKKSLLDKNPGDLWQKFAGLRALLGYQYACPGKKLMFMGCEFGQFIEWNFDQGLDWLLLAYERHPQVRDCVRALNRLYRETPALYEQDDSWDGFEWLVSDDVQNSVVVFLRRARSGAALVCAINFTPVFFPIYRVGLPAAGRLYEVFNTDRAEYGGSNQYNAFELNAMSGGYGGHPYWTEICLPPMSCVYLAYESQPIKPKQRARFVRLSCDICHKKRQQYQVR